jgi:hypothetical protein
VVNLAVFQTFRLELLMIEIRIEKMAHIIGHMPSTPPAAAGATLARASFIRQNVDHIFLGMQDFKKNA